MEKVLLHVCCAPCSTHSIEVLKRDHDVVLLFSNSNIYPLKEYEKRLLEARKIAGMMELELVEDEYCHDAWLLHIRGLESEPEKGRRCHKCFEFNLLRTMEHARRMGIGLFTTTLTISPHKDSKKIFEIGKKIAADNGLVFLEEDFKKKDGFRCSTELSKKHGLYRQDYCGCEFSIRR